MILLLSCKQTANTRDVENDMWLYNWTHYQVSQYEELNNELIKKLDSLDKNVILIASNAIDTLSLLQEYIIENAGGYRDNLYLKIPD